MRRPLRVTIGLFATAAIGGAPTGIAGAASVDSPTYGYGNARQAGTPGGVGIAAHTALHLHTAWRVRLSGAIDGQPLIVNGVHLHHGVRSLVFVGTEHGDVVALDLRSGKILWRRHTATTSIDTSCMASPDGTMGVTGTMVADKASRRVYAVDGIGRAWAFHMYTGKAVKGWPVFVHPPGPDLDWGALALSRGWLYAPTASGCDMGHYFGGIRAVNVANPRRRRDWLTTQGTSSYGGGIWGWGG
ncbi:MAG: PQQ-binding-like beta-propeller repeat protein, partial [Solirubrobacterales bacterium]|nr:PQQ-binding-like beta-propeller repeat protein [Solirubrobacterales bacterium]